MKDLIYCICGLLFLLSCADDAGTVTAPNENPFYDRAYAFLDSGTVDSAFRYFDQAADVFLAQHDSLNVANCLIQMAIIQSNQNDYFGAQETSLQANDYLNPDDPDHRIYLSANFNNLGKSTYYLKDYARAIAFYDSAARFSDDTLNIRVILNNKAKAYHDNGQYTEALRIYEHILPGSRERPLEYARILTNMANSRWYQDRSYPAAGPLRSALEIREQKNDHWGRNSSYAHLAEYYTRTRPDSAVYFARKRYAVAKRINSADDQLLALQQLIRLLPGDSAKWYFDTYRRLDDSVQAARSAAKNQFALIRYEVEKSKAENLRLQQESALRQLQLNRQRTLTAAVSVSALILLAGGAYWYRKRRQRLELEAQNRVNESRLRTSKRVHDVVANGLYRIMAEIENRPAVDRDRLLDRLEDLYEKSRDISYEDDPVGTGPDFYHRMSDMLKSFATSETMVVVAGNDAETWQGVSGEARYEIGHVLQELMVNMRKHSGASRVAVHFHRDGQRLSIRYTDNGRGLPADFRKGNGLTNTGNRIERLGGMLTFDPEAGGLKISISIPLH